MNGFITEDYLEMDWQLQLFTFNINKECYTKVIKNTKHIWAGLRECYEYLDHVSSCFIKHLNF
jgi:hypothetical protein